MYRYSELCGEGSFQGLEKKKKANNKKNLKIWNPGVAHAVAEKKKHIEYICNRIWNDIKRSTKLKGIFLRPWLGRCIGIRGKGL